MVQTSGTTSHPRHYDDNDLVVVEDGLGEIVVVQGGTRCLRGLLVVNSRRRRCKERALTKKNGTFAASGP